MDFNEYHWGIISRWFPNTARREIIDFFNSSAQEAYVSGALPILLKIGITAGESAYKHETSKFFASGIRISIISEQTLTKEQCVHLAMVILTNAQLVRLLTVRGWDTLEIVFNKGLAGLKWELKNFA